MKETFTSLLEVGGAVIKILDENPDADLYLQIHVRPDKEVPNGKLFTLSVFGDKQ